jgi:hypothetical protein
MEVFKLLLDNGALSPDNVNNYTFLLYIDMLYVYVYLSVVYVIFGVDDVHLYYDDLSLTSSVHYISVFICCVYMYDVDGCDTSNYQCVLATFGHV